MSYAAETAGDHRSCSEDACCNQTLLLCSDTRCLAEKINISLRSAQIQMAGLLGCFPTVWDPHSADFLYWIDLEPNQVLSVKARLGKLQPVSRLGSIYYRQMWRYLQAPKILDRHFVAVDGPAFIFSMPGLAVKCHAHFCATATSNWLGSQFATLGSQSGPQGLLRGPRGPKGPSGAPQRPLLGLNLGLRGGGLNLGLGLHYQMPNVAERQRCFNEATATVAGLRWLKYFSSATMWRNLAAQIFF